MFFGLGHPGRQMIAGKKGPSLALDFMTPGSLDPRITFTRASTATYFDSSGVMRTAAMNLALYSEDFTQAVWQKQSANGPALPVVTADQIVAPNGGMTADRIVYPDASALNAVTQVQQAIILSAGIYTFSIYLRGAVGGERTYIFIRPVGTYDSRIAVTLTTAWQRFSITSSAPVSGSVGFYIGTDLRDAPQTATSAQTIYAWGAQVESGSVASTYAPTAAVTNGAPRWDYDPGTLALRGLLLEEQRANLALSSANLSTGDWSSNAVTLTAGIAGAPDGTAAMTRVTETSTTDYHFVSQNTSITPSSLYAMSVYAKASGIRYLQLSVDDGPSTSGGYATFDLQTGTVSGPMTAIGGAAIGSASIQAVGNGIYRCSIVTTSTVAVVRRLLSASNVPAPGFAPSYAGNSANSVLLWGAQFELGTFASSYIPTTSAAVTRAFDDATLPTASFGYSSVAGTLALDMSGIHAGGTFGGLAGAGGFSDSTYLSNNGLSATELSHIIIIAGSGISVTTLGLDLAAPLNKMAGAYTAGRMIVACNGTIGAPGVTPGPFVRTLLRLGGAPWDSSSKASACTQRVRYWPRALSDAELVQVTTVPPSLDLSFMSPGVLDPRITFTRASTGTYTDASGVMQTAAINEPRWDYDPVTRVLRGMLIEEARTNLCLQSADMSNASWAKGAAVVALPVVTANQTLAPDGTLSADRVVYPLVTGAGAVSQLQMTYTATVAAYTLSVWLKGSVGGEQVYIYTQAGGANYARLRCTLTTAWQRFTLTTPNLSATGWSYGIGTDLRDASQTSTPAQTIYAWGGQIELGAFATSYIPTTSAAATRAVDVASMPTASWFNANGGTVQAEFMARNPAAAGAQNGILCMADAGPNLVIMLIATDGSIVLYGTVASVAQLNSSVSLISGNAQKVAIVYAASGWRGAAMGATIAPGGNAVPVPVTALNIGSSSSGGTAWKLNGHIQRIVYWPRALSDAELQQITT